jgi:putative ABC transport system substrate-binding protein
MKTNALFAGFGVILSLGIAQASQAQNGVPRIGFLSQCSTSFGQEHFTQALRELGYSEGRNLQITWRHFAEPGPQLRSAADQLVASKVDVLVTCSTAATRAAVDSTKTIPIVFAGIADPIASGIVASLPKPGANATGVSVRVAELYPKRLDLLRQVAPRVKRVVFLVNLSSPGSALAVEPLRVAAKTLNIHLDIYNTPSSAEVNSALRAIKWDSIDGLMTAGDTVLTAQGAKIAEAVRKARVPAVFPWREFHKYGVLMSYGSDPAQIMRRAAWYVDRILKGAKPEELPVEEVSRMELIIDLRMARETGIEVPQELLYRADEVKR